MNELECSASLNAEEQNSLDVICIIIHIVLITLLVLLSPITKASSTAFLVPNRNGSRNGPFPSSF